MFCTNCSDKFGGEMDEDQMMIDAGQKEFGAKQCPTCGLVFELGNPSDETSHRDYHDHLLTALKYTVRTRPRPHSTMSIESLQCCYNVLWNYSMTLQYLCIVNSWTHFPGHILVLTHLQVQIVLWEWIFYFKGRRLETSPYWFWIFPKQENTFDLPPSSHILFVNANIIFLRIFRYISKIFTSLCDT